MTLKEAKTFLAFGTGQSHYDRVDVFMNNWFQKIHPKEIHTCYVMFTRKFASLFDLYDLCL